MPNRYKTSAEVAGATRRTKNWRDKMVAAGMKYRGFWINEHEHTAIKKLLQDIRTEKQSEAR